MVACICNPSSVEMKGRDRKIRELTRQWDDLLSEVLGQQQKAESYISGHVHKMCQDVQFKSLLWLCRTFALKVFWLGMALSPKCLPREHEDLSFDTLDPYNNWSCLLICTHVLTRMCVYACARVCSRACTHTHTYINNTDAEGVGNPFYEAGFCSVTDGLSCLSVHWRSPAFSEILPSWRFIYSPGSSRDQSRHEKATLPRSLKYLRGPLLPIQTASSPSNAHRINPVQGTVLAQAHLPQAIAPHLLPRP